MIRFASAALAIAAVFSATSAQALSCMKPSAAGTYKMAADADERFYVAKGTLKHTGGPRAPRNDADGLPQPYTATAHFDGYLGTKSGFTHAHSAPVTVEVTCVAHWCGGVPEGDGFYFLEIRDSGLFFTSNACPTFWLWNDAGTEEILKGCLAGRKCDVDEF